MSNHNYITRSKIELQFEYDVISKFELNKIDCTLLLSHINSTKTHLIFTAKR